MKLDLQTAEGAEEGAAEHRFGEGGTEESQDVYSSLVSGGRAAAPPPCRGGYTGRLDEALTGRAAWRTRAGSEPEG